MEFSELEKSVDRVSQLVAGNFIPRHKCHSGDTWGGAHASSRDESPQGKRRHGRIGIELWLEPRDPDAMRRGPVEVVGVESGDK